jgi:hypothetical protein
MIVLPMTSVTAMSAVHEYVHQRAQENRQPDEGAQDVGAVLGEQQQPGNNQKADQHQPRRRGEKAALIAMAIMIVQRHWHPIRSYPAATAHDFRPADVAALVI